MRKEIKKQIKNVVDVVVDNKKQMFQFDFLQKLFFKKNKGKVESEEYDPPKEKKELIPTYSKKKNITKLEETKKKIMQTNKGLHNIYNQEETNLVVLDEIKSEVNLMKLPFFALSRQGSKTPTKINYKDSVTRGDERIDFFWKVSPSLDYGFPGIFDKKVFKAIEQIINQNGWSDKKKIENPVPFSFYQICKILDIRDVGTNINAIREALRRMVATTISSQGAFYQKNKKKSLYEDTFHLYDRIILKNDELPDGNIADTNFLFLGSAYLESLNAFYVKIIDYKYYQGLKSDIARRLYEILDIKFYGLKKHCVSIEYEKLCALLPIKQQKKYSDATRYLMPAHYELMALYSKDDKKKGEKKGEPIPSKKKYLQAVKWSRANKFSKEWIIEYYPTKETTQKLKSEPIEVKPEPAKLNAGIQKPTAQEKPKEPKKNKQASSPQEQPKEKIKNQPEPADTLTAELTKRNVSKSQIPKLLTDYKDRYPKSDIMDVLECFDHKGKQGELTGLRNKTSLLVNMIRTDDCQASGYKTRAQRATAKKDYEKIKRTMKSQEERERQEALKAWQANKTPQAKLDYMWPGFRIIHNTKLKTLTDKQIADLKKSIIREIKTDSKTPPSTARLKELIESIS